MSLLGAAAATSDTVVALEQMLEARERRAAGQAAALAHFAKPLVSVTVVMPGPVKDNPLSRRLLVKACIEIESAVSDKAWPVVWKDVSWRATGPEALLVVDAPPGELKAAMIELEDRHGLGRLWDLDVIAPGPRIFSRKDLGFAPRKCLVCDLPAAECGRSRRHPLVQLLDTMQAMVDEHDRHTYA